MSHVEFYLSNEVYADFLAGWDPGFYAKYAEALRPDRPGGRALDIGCGAGQVVSRLKAEGFIALGVDVSAPSIRRARSVKLDCRLYEGRRLPFPDSFFASAGALNVLEHVEEPEAFIEEIVRVVEVGGRVVLSSPNFFRVFGLRDYHPRMRGLANKWRNWRRFLSKRREMRAAPERTRFDRLEPIRREPFQPDDDAIAATNLLEMRFFLERSGCEIVSASCADRQLPRPLEWALDLTPLRNLILNAFLVARRVR